MIVNFGLMEGVKAHCQCLLFMVRQNQLQPSEELIASSRERGAKGFALLPSSVVENHPQLSQFFVENSIEILGDPVCPSIRSALQNDLVELIEAVIINCVGGIILESQPSALLRVSVEAGNKKCVNELFGRKVVIYNTQVESSNLLKAVDEGNISTVENLLSVRADISFKSLTGGTFFHLAILRDQETLVNLLLKHRANVNAEGTNNLTPLHLAVQQRNLNLISILLDKGANIDVAKDDGKTSLLLAVEQGDVKVVELLLKHHPDVNNKNNKKALTVAVLSRNNGARKMVDMLLEGGFFFDAAETKNIDLLREVVRKNNLVVLQCLLKPRIDVNNLVKPLSELRSSSSLLCEAIKQGNEEMVKLLLDAGANPSHESFSQAPIYEAVNGSNLNIVKLLLAYGARADGDGRTVCLAAKEGHVEIVEALLQSGFRVDFEGSDRRLAIVCAAESNHPEVVEILLKYGASCDGRGKFGRTALHAAAEGGYRDVIRILVEHGANLEVRCPKGETPLMYAVENGHLHAVELLLKYGARIDVTDTSGGSAVRTAVEDGYTEIFQILLDYGFNNPHLLRRTDICEYLKGKVNFQAQIFIMLRHIGFEEGDLENDLKCCRMLAFHIIRSTAAGLLCGGENSSLAWDCRENNPEDFKRECEAEVVLLKSENVADTNVSFYEVLMSNKTRLTGLARNPGVVQTIESGDYKARFPIYAGCLHYQFLRGYERRMLLNEGIRLCHVLFRHLSAPLQDLKEKILGYLSDKELRILITLSRRAKK